MAIIELVEELAVEAPSKPAKPRGRRPRKKAARAEAVAALAGDETAPAADAEVEVVRVDEPEDDK